MGEGHDRATIGTAARDAAYTMVGFGLLGFQRSQVRRRELQRELGRLTGRAGEVGAGLGQVARDLDQRADPVVTQVGQGLDQVEAALPGPASNLLHQARVQAAGARRELRRLLTAA